MSARRCSRDATDVWSEVFILRGRDYEWMLRRPRMSYNRNVDHEGNSEGTMSATVWVLLLATGQNGRSDVSSERFLLLVLGFSMISRCTHRAHAAFRPIETLDFSLQSIMRKFEVGPAARR